MSAKKKFFLLKDNSTAVQIKEGSVLEKLDAFKQETGKNEQQPRLLLKTWRSFKNNYYCDAA